MPDGNKLVAAELVCDHDTVAPGQTALLGVRLEMEPGWHTYWRNPGDSGLPIKVTFEEIKGVTFGEIRWPTPDWHLGAGDILDYVYSGTTMLFIPITVDADVPKGQIISVGCKIEWLVCKGMCVPGSAERSIDLDIADKPIPSDGFDVIHRKFEGLPEEIGEGFSTPAVQLEWAGAVLHVRCSGADAVTVFLDYSEETSPLGSPALRSQERDTLHIPFDPAPDQFLEITGVVTVDRGRDRESYEFAITGPAVR